MLYFKYCKQINVSTIYIWFAFLQQNILWTYKSAGNIQWFWSQAHDNWEHTGKTRFLLIHLLVKMKALCRRRALSATHRGFKSHSGDQIDGGSSKALKRSSQIAITSSGLPEASALLLPPSSSLSLPPSDMQALVLLCGVFARFTRQLRLETAQELRQYRSRSGPPWKGFSVIRFFFWELKGEKNNSDIVCFYFACAKL